MTTPMPSKPCYLRETTIELLDGNSYKFRALPFSRRTVDLVETLTHPEDGSETNMMRAIIDAVELSLSYDQTPEEIEAIMSSGAIPMPGQGHDELTQQIMQAMIAGSISSD